MADTPFTGYFNVHKYSTPDSDGATDAHSTFVSPSDLMADGAQGLGMVISFKHEPSGNSVFFKAFITALNESYSSDWTEEVVYGRTDPIQLFKNTSRRISLGFKIPAETVGEAYDNLARLGQLTQFLYPAYTSVGRAQTIAQGPVIRLKVMNLIAKTGHLLDTTEEAEVDAGPAADSFNGYKSSPDASLGLMGVITSLNISHNLESTDIGIFEKTINTILASMIEVNLDFTVIHEKALGWKLPANPGGFSDTLFPYNTTAMSAEESASALGRRAAARAANDAEPPENDQARAAAEARYMTLGGKARMKKDLVWLNKMKGKDTDDLSVRQKQNMKYIEETLSGAGVKAGDMEGSINRRTARARAGGAYDEFVDRE